MHEKERGFPLFLCVRNEHNLSELTRLCELLATYLLRKLKGELLGKTVLLPPTIIYQARLVVPTLKEFVLVCQPQQIDACVDVSVMMRTTVTCPFTDIYRLLLTFLATRRTDLYRCVPLVDPITELDDFTSDG